MYARPPATKFVVQMKDYQFNQSRDKNFRSLGSYPTDGVGT